MLFGSRNHFTFDTSKINGHNKSSLMRLKILVANNHFSFNQRRITNRPIYPAAKNIVKKDVRNQELKKKIATQIIILKQD
jgi:hypothetical protein